MKLLGSHTIRVDNLKSLKEELDKLPDSVLESATVVDAELREYSETNFGWNTIRTWNLILDLEWPVEPV